MSRARLAILAALLSAPLAGCSTLGSATEDHTLLRGEVPIELGRILEVRIEGGDEATRLGLVDALSRELVSRDLFDRVKPVPHDAPGRNAAASTLFVSVLSHELREVWDLFELQSGLAARVELAIELRDQLDAQVLDGHVTGVAADIVSDDEELERPERRQELRVAALHHASMKLSRALRRAAQRRGHEAMARLPDLRFPRGVGPVTVVVLGVDDPSGGRRRGHSLTDALQEAFGRLGAEVEVVPRPEVRRAIAKRDTPLTSYWEIARYELDELARELGRGDYAVVARIELGGDRVKASGKLLDRRGETVATAEGSAVGLGAVRVVAAQLAGRLGTRLAQLP